MPLKIDEAFSLGLRIGHLTNRTQQVVLDKDTRDAATASWETILAALQKTSPRGRRITADEAKSIYRSLLDLLRSLGNVNSDEAHALHDEVIELAHHIVRDILD